MIWCASVGTHNTILKRETRPYVKGDVSYSTGVTQHLGTDVSKSGYSQGCLHHKTVLSIPASTICWDLQ